MRDSPTPGRHRSKARRRGLIGPIVSALSVLLAIGPVVWVMTSQDGSTVANDNPTKVLNVSADNSAPTSANGSDSAAGHKTAVPTVTATLPNGSITTPTPSGTPAVSPTGSAGGTPVVPTVPTTVPATTPNGDVKTDTITPPANPQTPAGNQPKPKPTATPTTTTTTTATQDPTPPPPPAGGSGTNTQEREVFDLTNAARRQSGCGPLSLDDSLVKAAGQHASDMVRRHYTDHSDPEGKSAFDRMEAAGFHGSAMGENIAAGYDTAQRVFAGWMQSDGHRKNILNCNYNKIGIGYDPGQVQPDYGNGSWVQDFGRS
jgi:uncharacterized protein YkwD